MCVFIIYQQMGASDHRGLTAVHHASSQGQERLLVALLERGADPEVSSLVPTTSSGLRLLHLEMLLCLAPSRPRAASCSIHL